MVHINWLITFLAALIPMVMGFIWYNPKVFGNAWIKATGLAEEELKNANMALIFGLTFLFSFMMATLLNTMVIHQFGFQSMMLMQGDEADAILKSTMEKYGNTYHTFKHGALHGTISGVFLALPIIGTLSLFERKSAKYIFIHVGYWVICMALMGGVICQFS